MKRNQMLDSVRRAAIVILVVVGVAASAAPITYYVDVAAAPGGTGGASDPFNTITAAVAALNADGGVLNGEGTVLVADGNYKALANGGNESFGVEGITLNKHMTIKGGYAGAGDWSEASRVPRTTGRRGC